MSFFSNLLGSDADSKLIANASQAGGDLVKNFINHSVDNVTGANGANSGFGTADVTRPDGGPKPVSGGNTSSVTAAIPQPVAAPTRAPTKKVLIWAGVGLALVAGLWVWKSKKG
jgi:hypothetical protein